MNRRGFLAAILAAGCAPAVVKASSLMPIFSRASSGLIVPDLVVRGESILTIDMITQEALRLIHQHAKFLHGVNRNFAAPTGDAVRIRVPAHA